MIRHHSPVCRCGIADFIVLNIFSNTSKGTAFLLQGMFETDPVAKDVTIDTLKHRLMLHKQKRYNLKFENTASQSA